jgi:hypothetical protein
MRILMSDTEALKRRIMMIPGAEYVAEQFGVPCTGEAILWHMLAAELEDVSR